MSVAYDVTRVRNLLLDEGLGTVRRVELRAQMPGCLPDRLWSESRTRPVARARIEGNTEYGHVAARDIAQLREPRKGRWPRVSRNNRTTDRRHGFVFFNAHGDCFLSIISR